MDDNLPAAPF